MVTVIMSVWSFQHGLFSEPKRDQQSGSKSTALEKIQQSSENPLKAQQKKMAHLMLEVRKRVDDYIFLMQIDNKT